MDLPITKAAAKEVISTLDGALDSKPTGLSRLLLAYSPEKMREFLVKGRLRLIHLKHHEDLLENAFKSLLDVKAEISKESKNGGVNPLLRMQLEQIEKEYRILSTVKKAIPYFSELDVSYEPNDSSSTENESLWWDMFEDLASRRNEPWRVDLFARTIALNDLEPGAVSLKALWEIALMESTDFAVLSMFLDSSLYIDGKPIVVMEPEEQYSYEADLNEYHSGNLALCISGLIDSSLIQRADTQFSTTEPVKLQYASGITYLIHRLKDNPDNKETAVRISGYSPTDHCMDICRLYTPSQNIASDRNFVLLKEMLLESVVSDDPSDITSTYEFVEKI